MLGNCNLDSSVTAWCSAVRIVYEITKPKIQERNLCAHFGDFIVLSASPLYRMSAGTDEGRGRDGEGRACTGGTDLHGHGPNRPVPGG